MNLALAEARQAAEENEIPVGAVVVRDGALLGRGHNRTRALSDPTAHAEILAITAACQAVGEEHLGADIYVTLEPCPMCAGAIILARFSRLYFGAWDAKAGACGSVIDVVREPSFNHTVEVYAGLLSEEAERLLQEFFTKLRNRKECE